MKIPGRQNKILANIGFLLALVIGVLMLVYIYVIPYLADWEQHKGKVLERARLITGREVIIDGQIDFTAFPLPKFTLNNVLIKNTEKGEEQYFLKVPYLEARPSILYLLLGEVRITSVTLIDPVVTLENFLTIGPNWSFNVGITDADKLAIEKTVSSYLDVDHIAIERAKIFYNSGEMETPEERLLLLDSATVSMESFSGPFESSGTFRVEGDTSIYNYEMTVGAPAEEGMSSVAATIGSSSKNIALSGAFSDYDKGLRFKGTLDASLDGSFRYFGKILAGVDKRIATLADKAIMTEPVSLTGDVSYSPEEQLSIDNMMFSTATRSATGNFHVRFGEVSRIDLTMFFDNINLDALSDDEGEALVLTKKRGGNRRRLRDSQLPSDLSVNLGFGAQALTYKNWTIEDFYYEVEAYKHERTLHGFKANKLPGNSHVLWSDDVDETGETVTKGLFKASSEDLQALLVWLDVDYKAREGSLKHLEVEASVNVKEDEYHIERLKCNLDTTHLLAQARLSRGDDLVSNAAIRIDKINFDDYFHQNAKDEEEDELNTELPFFTKLRNIDNYFSKLALSLEIKEFTYNNHVFNSLATLSKVSKGTLNLEKFSVNSELGKIAGTLGVDARLLKPQVKIDLGMDKLNSDFVTKVLGWELTKPIDVVKDESLQEKRVRRGRWSKDLWNFRRFTTVEGSGALRIKEFVHNGFTLDDVKTEFSITSDSIQIDSLSAGVFDTQIDVSGSIGTKRPSMNIKFSLGSADINSILYPIFDINKISGKASLSGSIAMSGNSLDQWISNLHGTGNIAARGLQVKGFDLWLFSRKVPTLKSIKEVRYWVHESLSRGESAIHYASGNAVLSDGTISFNNLSLSHDVLSAALMKIDLNLYKWIVDVKAAMRVKAGSADVPLNLAIYGNISKPAVVWDKETVEKYWEKKFFR